MSDKSTIEWTDATWNPVTGCTKISPACKHCYAETFAERFRGVHGHPFEQGFDLKLWPERLSLPSKWGKPKMIFVNSMSDLFHEGVSDEFIGKVFDVMTEARQHTFQVLTKRSKRLAEWAKANYSKRAWPPNVWIGVSIENQDYIWRIDDLIQVPANVRFLSLEPLLGPIALEPAIADYIHWVIVGGESGPKARQMNPKWAMDIRDQCLRHKIKFFFKQWGTYNKSGERVGKKAAGRKLDGETWDEMPLELAEIR
ncbi:phage Gp37/Gp68 family protein [Candidatus Peregrinibacteria bacterium]|nr:phage Gp37/Gp68 family protein [Candidatus Peregrinibacteria bacterium]